MTSSIRSQSIARRSSYGDTSSVGVVKASASQRGTPNDAIGVLASLGGPGGAGRIGSGRTRSWPDDEIDPSSAAARRALGELGVVIRTSGEVVAVGDSVCVCGGGGRRSKPGRAGRELGDGVPGGDHAGGGVLGRAWWWGCCCCCWLGSGSLILLYGTGGRSVGAGG